MEAPVAISLLALLVLLDVAALRWGRDSRDGFVARRSQGGAQ